MPKGDHDMQCEECGRPIDFERDIRCKQLCRRCQKDPSDAREEQLRAIEANVAAVKGALAAARGQPLCTVADSGYRARSRNGDAWENGWGQVAHEIDMCAAGRGECSGLSPPADDRVAELEKLIKAAFLEGRGWGFSLRERKSGNPEWEDSEAKAALDAQEGGGRCLK